MKKISLFILCLGLGFVQLRAQSYLGYTYNNYEAASGMVFNPASIAGSSYTFDFNIISSSGGFGTNAYRFDRSSTYKLNLSGWEESRDFWKVNSNNSKYAWGSLDIIGPSFMLSLSPKHAIGFSSRIRLMSNIDNLSNDVFQLLGGDQENAIYGTTFKQEGLRGNVHGFADLGLSYARVLYEDDNHKVKAGITGKMVFGLAAVSFKADNISINMLDYQTINEFKGSVSAAYSSGFDAMVNDSFSGNDIFDYIDARGWGMDVGVVYEWTSPASRANVDEGSKQRTAYKLRVAASVSDIGSKLRYKAGENSGAYTANIGPNTSSHIFNLNDRSIDQYISDLEADNYLTLNNVEELNVSLPSLLRINVDYNVWKRFYINADGALSLIGKNATGARYLNTVAITPRYESRFIGVYSPISYSNENSVGWGIGINFGTFYIGSGSVLSNLIKNDIKNIDIHAGVHIPLFRKNKNKAAKQQQQVWVEPKQEEDSKDKDIEIPESAVYTPPARYPDTIPTAKKPQEAKTKQPLPTDSDVNKQVELLTHSIHFVTGSDWLLIESREPLDRIADILNANPDVMVDIKGYTDGAGTDSDNYVLSVQRAESVKRYLEGRGVATYRMSTEGFGANDPVADNSTESGKYKNRRVEMRLYY